MMSEPSLIHCHKKIVSDFSSSLLRPICSDTRRGAAGQGSKSEPHPPRRPGSATAENRANVAPASGRPVRRALVRNILFKRDITRFRVDVVAPARRVGRTVAVIRHALPVRCPKVPVDGVSVRSLIGFPQIMRPSLMRGALCAYVGMSVRSLIFSVKHKMSVCSLASRAGGIRAMGRRIVRC